MMGHLVRRLATNSFLAAFTDAERACIVERMILKSYPPGAYVHRKGDPPDGYYCVVGGYVDIGSVTRTGAEIRLIRIGPQSWFGEISVLDGQPRTSDAIAVASAELARLPMPAIAALTAEIPGFRDELVRNLCRRFRQAFSGIDDIMTRTPEERLAQWLLDNSEPDGLGARVDVNQEVLAAMIGVSRQSINAYIGKWAARGLVAAGYGFIRIPDEAAFLALAGRGR